VAQTFFDDRDDGRGRDFFIVEQIPPNFRSCEDAGQVGMIIRREWP